MTNLNVQAVNELLDAWIDAEVRLIFRTGSTPNGELDDLRATLAGARQRTRAIGIPCHDGRLVGLIAEQKTLVENLTMAWRDEVASGDTMLGYDEWVRLTEPHLVRCI